ncbi:MAG: nitrilase-related carbon-nitrogen hydrolase, partial [Acidimicrobiales bacterium]
MRQDVRSAGNAEADEEAEGLVQTVGLVAVQMAMDLDDYTESGFQAAVSRSAEDAMASLDPIDGALLVFPEHLGFLLPVVAFHRDEARAAWSFQELIEALSGGDPMERRQLWIANAADAFELYESTFCTVARTHGVYVVAGSITTPILDRSPHRDGGVLVSETTLMNVSPLVGPSGRCLSHTTKVRIPPGEDKLVTPGRLDDLAPTTTSIGSIGTALCFDGYHERPIERLDAQGAQIVAQPTHFPGPEIRYDGTGTMVPAYEDFGRLIQGRENIRVGVSAALVGEPFRDRRAEGKSHIILNAGDVDADWADIVVAEASEPM